ncbi:MAG TPA: AAA family ATPase [Ktedonobacteraceae bacterium]|nr:AAA family ATPase [Ktedonobacteraceae bacterium]
MNGKVTYRQHVSFCGKPKCRKCRDGIGHGPYWYAYQVIDGHTVRRYIGKHLPAEAKMSENPLVELDSLQQVDLHIAHGALPEAIDILDRLLAIDPANEKAVQRLVLALARLKRRGEALQAYQRLASILQKSHNAVPSPETQDVYRAVLQGDEITLPPASTKGDHHPHHIQRPLPGSSPSLPQPSSKEPGTTKRKDFLSQKFPPAFHIGRINQSQLVGRDRELAVCRQLLLIPEAVSVLSKSNRQVLAENLTRMNASASVSSARFMVLMGEAGIGKTRLAEEVAREALQREWAVIWSNAYAQESGIPYRVWTEALRKLITQELWQEAGVSAQKQLYQPLKALLPELQELLPQSASQRSSSAYSASSPEQEQLQLREAVYDLFTTISAHKPLMIVLDDIQWADRSSCELLGYLARRLQGHAIAVLATCRDQELSSSHSLRSLFAHMQREHTVEMLHVQPLTDAQIGILVSNLPQKTVQHIQIQAGGNPFFAEELASFFHTGAAIGEHQPQTKSAETSLPATIIAALDQRLNRLSAACYQLLSTAAVLGRSFGFPLIATIEAKNTGYDEDAVLDLLEEALQSGILAEEGTGTRISYSFWHPLFATHLYNRLSSTKRARLHRRAAEALQQIYAGREHELAATIVRHLVNGGAEPARIAHYAEMAANYAYNLSAYAEAERYYRLAVEYIEKDHLASDAATSFEARSRLAFLLERQAECTRIQGDFKQARSLFERVLETRASLQESQSISPAPPGPVPSPLDPAMEAQIQALLWGEIGWTWRYTGDTAQARACCERGEQLLRDAGISAGPAWARLRFQQASLSWQQGQYEEARHAIEQALHLFESTPPLATAKDADLASLTRTRRTLLGDPVDLGRAYALLGAILNATGQRTEALASMDRALAIYQQNNRQREIAHVCCNIGHIHLKKAEYQRAEAYLRRSLDLAERSGDTPLIAVVFHNLGELAASAGKLLEATALYKRSLELAQQFNDREYLSLWNADLATVLREQGHLAEATTCVGQALSTARAIRNAPCIGLALVVLGELRIAQATVASPARTPPDQASATAVTKQRNKRPTTGIPPVVLLARARATLRHALALPGLEAETRTRAQLALAHLALLLQDREAARQHATQAIEEANHHELMALLARSQQLVRALARDSSLHSE